jgi:uridine phosphorylase
MSGHGHYHLTPKTLVGERFGVSVFGDIRIALIGYCPPPSALDAYAPQRVTDQHFIHVSPDSVRILSHAGRRFLSLAHVYGGPVSSATVEELAYYGIDTILAYGLAGGLGTKNLIMGDFYRVDSACAFDGTTPHYTADKIVSADETLRDSITALWPTISPSSLTSVRAATGDAIYRESDAVLDDYRAQACDIVNLDSAHLFAASLYNSAGRRLRTIQCGVLSDIVSGDAHSESTLGAMLSATGATGLNPLEKTGDIVRFYIETLAPRL